MVKHTPAQLESAAKNLANDVSSFASQVNLRAADLKKLKLDDYSLQSISSMDDLELEVKQKLLTESIDANKLTLTSMIEQLSCRETTNQLSDVINDYFDCLTATLHDNQLLHAVTIELSNRAHDQYDQQLNDLGVDRSTVVSKVCAVWDEIRELKKPVLGFWRNKDSIRHKQELADKLQDLSHSKLLYSNRGESRYEISEYEQENCVENFAKAGFKLCAENRLQLDQELQDQLKSFLDKYRTPLPEGHQITPEFIKGLMPVEYFMYFASFAYDLPDKDIEALDPSIHIYINRLDQEVPTWRAIFVSGAYDQHRILSARLAEVYADVMSELVSMSEGEVIPSQIESLQHHLPSASWIRAVYVRSFNEVRLAEELLNFVHTEDLLSIRSEVNIDDNRSYSNVRYEPPYLGYHESNARESFDKVMSAFRGYDTTGVRTCEGGHRIALDLLINLTLDSSNPLPANKLRREEFYRRLIAAPQTVREVSRVMNGSITGADWHIRKAIGSHNNNVVDDIETVDVETWPAELKEAKKLLDANPESYYVREDIKWKALLYIRQNGSSYEKKVATNLCRDLCLNEEVADILLDTFTDNPEGSGTSRSIIVSSVIKNPSSGVENLLAALRRDTSLVDSDRKFLACVALSTAELKPNYTENEIVETLSIKKEELVQLSKLVDLSLEETEQAAIGIATFKKLKIQSRGDWKLSYDLVDYLLSSVEREDIIEIGRDPVNYGQLYEEVKSAISQTYGSGIYDALYLIRNTNLVKEHIEEYNELKQISRGSPKYSDIKSSPRNIVLNEMGNTRGSFIYAATKVDVLSDGDLDRISKCQLNQKASNASEVKELLQEINKCINSKSAEDTLLKAMLSTAYWTKYISEDLQRFEEVKKIASHTAEVCGQEVRLAHDMLGVITSMLETHLNLKTSINLDEFPLIRELVRSSGNRLFSPDLEANLDRRNEVQEAVQLCAWYLEAQTNGNLPNRLTLLINKDISFGASIIPGLFRLPFEYNNDESVEVLADFLKDAPATRTSLVLNQGLKLATGPLNLLSNQSQLPVVMQSLGQIADAGFGTLDGFNGVEQIGGILRDQQIALAPSEVPIIVDFFRDFGVSPYPSLFMAYRALSMGGAVPKSLVGDSVTLSGKQGISELKTTMNTLLGALVNSGQFSMPSPVELEVIAAITRYHESQWKTNVNFESFLNSFQFSAQQGQIAPVPDHMKPGSFLASRLDERSAQNFSMSHDCSLKVSEYLKDIQWCEERSADRVFSEVKAELIFELKQIESVLTAKKKELSREEEVKAITKQMGMLSDAIKVIEKSKDHCDLLHKVSSHKFSKREAASIAAPLRRLCFKSALELNHSEPAVLKLVGGNIDISTLAPVLEFVEHHVLEEGVKKVEMDGTKLSTKQCQELKHYFPTKIFRDELKRYQGIASSEQETIMAIPNRSVLGEASGQICDACWSRQPNILANNPTIVPVLFGKNLDSLDAKLLGATLLIPAQVLGTDEKVILVRGLNPLQSAITKYNVGTFVEGFLDYIESWASDAGYSKILIVGDGSGRAQTNRPDISLYLSEKYVKGKSAVLLADAPALSFNHYQVSSICYTARDLTKPIAEAQLDS
jgi:hypothetical protein